MLAPGDCGMAAVTVSLEQLLARLRAAAEVAENMHRENLLLFTEDAMKLLAKGDVRDAAEKTWAAYKSFLGLLVAKKLLPVVEKEAVRIAEKKGLGKAEEYVEWWIKQGLLIPSTRQRIAEIVKKLVDITGDREIAEKRAEAVLLHIFFYHGPDIAEIDEEEAADITRRLIEWIRRKSREYRLL